MSFENEVLLLLIIGDILLLMNFNSGRGSFAKGYMNGFKDGIKACVDEVKNAMKNQPKKEN